MKAQDERQQYYGMTREEFNALVEKRRTEQFLGACHLPVIWLDRAYLHKRGADILYEIAYAASEREFEREIKRINEQKDKTKAFPVCESRTLEGEELQDHYDRRLLAEYLLLVGYALECLFKGYLLSILPELVIDEKRIDKLVANHDLVQLCHECAITLSDDERDLLKLMTRHILWGKYTAPLTRGHMPSWIDPEDQKEKSLAIGNPFHERRVQVLADNVYARASSLLEKERQRRNLASSAV